MTATATEQLTAVQTKLVAERDRLIGLVTEENATIETLRGRKDEKAQKVRWSAGGRKANRIVEIKDVELDMATEGLAVTPFVDQPVSARRDPEMTEEKLSANLAKVRKVHASPQTPDSVKATAEKRIKSILESAKKYGYSSIQ